LQRQEQVSHLSPLATTIMPPDISCALQDLVTAINQVSPRQTDTSDVQHVPHSTSSQRNVDAILAGLLHQAIDGSLHNRQRIEKLIQHILRNPCDIFQIVFRRPHPKIDLHLSTFSHIEQVSEAKLLSVIFTSNLLWDSHINFTLKACSQRSFLLRRLRDQGLTRKQLNIFHDAIIISRIMYASQAWSGFFIT
jgi:hypothetical protein